VLAAIAGLPTAAAGLAVTVLRNPLVRAGRVCDDTAVGDQTSGCA